MKNSESLAGGAVVALLVVRLGEQALAAAQRAARRDASRCRRVALLRAPAEHRRRLQHVRRPAGRWGAPLLIAVTLLASSFVLDAAHHADRWSRTRSRW
jgi:hypothetical protein